eukprot:CAMPEP_0179461836 /NCGR_PEP_ID=MMETSP0799-20121207/44424_1 /TAXON_ID=46947 /ORGANISM="Geminigera cryophila, Strain CCMP2564" /LENGTH=31 /DNA_ID= /DNA_START= /DNA_END= /DNA_ORIENTATION=
MSMGTASTRHATIPITTSRASFILEVFVNPS